MKLATDHVLIVDSALTCTRCGAEEALPASGSVRWVATLLNAFDALHRRCRGERRKRGEKAPRIPGPAKIGGEAASP